MFECNISCACDDDEFDTQVRHARVNACIEQAGAPCTYECMHWRRTLFGGVVGVDPGKDGASVNIAEGPQAVGRGAQEVVPCGVQGEAWRGVVVVMMMMMIVIIRKIKIKIRIIIIITLITIKIIIITIIMRMLTIIIAKAPETGAECGLMT